MKIAVVADIHSNYIAFQSVMNDINSRNIDTIIFLGDYIFGGYGSNETIDLLMDYSNKNSGHVIIAGNIDELITPIEENADWVYPVNRQIYNELGKKRISFLKSLPSETHFNVEGITMLLCHDPSDVEVFKMVDNLKRENNIPNLSGLIKVAEGMESDVCIFGHYHLFMDQVVNGKRFICPSSVGMPFNGDSRAQYMILDIIDSNITSSRQYVEYNRLKIVEDFEKLGYYEKHYNWTVDIVTTILTAHNYIGTQSYYK